MFDDDDDDTLLWISVSRDSRLLICENEGNLQLICSFFNQINGEFCHFDVVFFLNGVHGSEFCHGNLQ